MQFKILKKAIETHSLSKTDIVYLIKNSNEELYKSADIIRKKYKGNSVHLRALIEFTNICRNDCFYCGLRRSNSKIERYRLTIDEIIKSALYAIKANFKTIVLQGGEDLYFDTDKICFIIKEIKKYDVAITLSLGQRF